MATYQQNYPALPGLASGENDDPAPAVAVGTPLDDAHAEAAHRQKQRRRVLYASENRSATLAEVQQAEKREFSILAEIASGNVAAPAWAVAMQNQMNNIENQTNNIEARQTNLVSSEPEHAITPLNVGGNLPPAVLFPQTRLDFDNLTGHQVGQLLVFYGLPNAPIATQRQRLKHHLGIRL